MGLGSRWCRGRDVLTKPGNAAPAADGTNTCCDRFNGGGDGFNGYVAFRRPALTRTHALVIIKSQRDQQVQCNIVLYNSRQQ